jgi:hypothetical protein
MAEPRVFIHAVAALGPHGDIAPEERRPLAGDPPPLVLKELVKKIVGVPLRQASHFVELATIGSQLCLKRLLQPAPENTAVYLGSGFAEMRKNDEVFRQVMPPGPGMASPFDFINTANNMAAFYTARLANFNARNLTVTQEEFSFEWALALARSDLRAGDYPQTLVGGVDENYPPRSAHLRRIRLRTDQYMGEGSGWLFLSTRPDGARAELLAICCHTHDKNPVTVMNEAVTEWRQNDEPVLLLPGFRMEANEIDALRAMRPTAVLESYTARCGAYPTATAFGLATTIEENRFPAGLVVHANRDALGQVMLTVLRKF